MYLRSLNSYKFMKKNIKGVCNDIDLIIAGKAKQVDYKRSYLHLCESLYSGLSENDVSLICETTLKIATTKNRILRYLEKDFWDFIYKIPFQIHLVIFEEDDESENHKLLPNVDYENENKRILSKLLGLVQDVMELKDDGSKGSEMRRVGALNLLIEMYNYFDIPMAFDIFINSITSNNKSEQYTALTGIKNHFALDEDTIDDDLVTILNQIKDKIDDRSVASACLQIQINAGIIDELTAVIEMDDWKDKHRD